VKSLFADRVELSDGQITRQGFLQLNQMEAEDNDDDLWITLNAMGYNNALVMDEVSGVFRGGGRWCDRPPWSDG